MAREGRSFFVVRSSDMEEHSGFRYKEADKQESFQVSLLRSQDGNFISI